MREEVSTLPLLDDLPAGKNEDKFHHEVYAQMLVDILKSNKPGIAVGLFGKWGHGKSTVIDILEGLFPDNYHLAVFNAWKSRGDSVRRQLLLNVLAAIESKQMDRMSRFTQTMLPFEFWRPEEQALRKEGAADAFLLKSRRPPWWVQVCAFLAGLSFLIILVSAILLLLGSEGVSRLSAFIGFGVAVGGPSLGGVVKWWQAQNRLLLAYTEPVSDSQKLKYPEQFESIFTTEVGTYCKRSGKRLVVVVDDLDRCDPDTIVEALSAIRQFTNTTEMHCQFVVPCDEMQVVLALEASGHNAGVHGARFHDYESEELLRKFFDVTLRMHELLPEDLTDFAAMLAPMAGLDEQEARELIGLANPKDPRLVKKLLNALRLSHERIRIGQQRGLFASSDDLPNLPTTERLLVVLRETKPEAYRYIVGNPSLLQPGDSEDDWKTLIQGERLTEKVVAVCRELIENAGAVSPVTAQELCYGQLPDELRNNPLAGRLIRAFRRFNHDDFRQVVSELDTGHAPKVQRWLCREAARVSSARALNRVLGLFVDYPDKDNDKQFIAPCVESAVGREQFLAESLANYARFEQLAPILPLIEARKEKAIYGVVVDNFVAGKGESERELRFLLETCKRFDDEAAQRFRRWLLEAVSSDKESDENVARIFQCMPTDKEKCSGFAPEVAAVVAGASEWADDPDEELRDEPSKWPRYNVITTLVGDSSAHADRCLSALLESGGQLASPQQITGSTPGIRPAWDTVAHLLKLVADKAVQAHYEAIHAWLTYQAQAEPLELILDVLGDSAFRLASEQTQELADFLVVRVQSQPSELYILEFIGKSSAEPTLCEGWQAVVDRFAHKYFKWLEVRPALSGQETQILNKMHELRWPVPEAAETLLIQKLQAPNVSAFDPWLEALAPLVANRRKNMREAVKTCIERNERPKQALAAGTKILWKTEIDAETAAVLGHFFITRQSQIPQYEEVWQELQDKSGAGAVLETMQEKLPSEAENLVSYRSALNMISIGFDTLDRRHKASFIDNRLLPLMSSNDPTAKQVGLEIASKIPSMSKALQKYLKEERKKEDFSESQRALMDEILKKDIF